MRIVDEVGKRYGKLTVIGSAGTVRIGKALAATAAWHCVCDCGNRRVVAGKWLRTGNTKSCGKCVPRGKKTHGCTRSEVYYVWRAMVNRCRNPKNKFFKDYGGRGIKVCDRWLDVRNFIQDMGARPKGATLERKDNEKGYGPDNCKWSTHVDQHNNTRASRRILVGGVSRTVAEWARITGISHVVIRSRLSAGWDDYLAITLPPIPQKLKRRGRYLAAAEMGVSAR